MVTMSAGGALAVALALLCQGVSSWDPFSDQCRRIKAAFNSEGKAYFLIEDMFVWTTDNTGFPYSNSLLETGAFPDSTELPTTAIVGPARNGDPFFSRISGTTEEVYAHFGDPSVRAQGSDAENHKVLPPLEQLKQAFRDEPNFESAGIGAAVEIPGFGGKFMLFSGCSHLVVAKASPGRPARALGLARPNSAMGLPCDVDSALTHPYDDKVYFIKGDQVWVDEGQSFDGPRPVHDMVAELNYFGLCSDHFRSAPGTP